MNKNIIISILFIGLIGMFSSCEKDETKTVISTDPIVPTIKTLPNLTLVRANGMNILEFIGTPVDPGFNASATYILEACAVGNNFADPVTIKSDVQDTSIKITISDLNGVLIKKFPADQVSAVDFRIRAILVIDAGTGYTPMEYISGITTANVTLYGLPRLDLMNNAIAIGKIESALGDGSYTGYVKLDPAKPFTFKNPDANLTYGSNGTALALNGTAITPTVSGWHKISADVNALTYSVNAYMVGLIGSSTPNGWSAPDSKMEYDVQTGIWQITLNLIVGAVKIRLNDGWDNGINLGLGDADHPEYTLSNLWNAGASKDIPITEAGNYTIKVTIGTSKYSCTITKNN